MIQKGILILVYNPLIYIPQTSEPIMQSMNLVEQTIYKKKFSFLAEHIAVHC